MEHNYTIKGKKFLLRPVTLEDAGFIVVARDNNERNQFVSQISLNVEDQQQWIRDYFSRSNDYYFVIENMTTSLPQGLISLYEVDDASKSAEWGRWVILPASLCAIESVYLLYSFAFGQLNLHKVFCNVITDNQAVIRFHENCGLIKERHIEKYYYSPRANIYYDSEQYMLDAEMWEKKIKVKLLKLLDWKDND